MAPLVFSRKKSGNNPFRYGLKAFSASDNILSDTVRKAFFERDRIIAVFDICSHFFDKAGLQTITGGEQWTK
jgi:hypothetical protein